MQFNTTIQEFQLGIRHGNVKRKIFNAQLYEKERKICTQRLSNALVKVYANNVTLKKLVVQYRHANFDECIKIGNHLINARKQNFNQITHFNHFPLHEYLTKFQHPTSSPSSSPFILNLCHSGDTFDEA